MMMFVSRKRASMPVAGQPRPSSTTFMACSSWATSVISLSDNGLANAGMERYAASKRGNEPA